MLAPNWWLISWLEFPKTLIKHILEFYLQFIVIVIIILLCYKFYKRTKTLANSICSFLE
jgi:membrane protein DedA with SNARE-associated domain